MPRVNFITREGERLTVDAPIGARLLEVAQNAGMPLEGTCEGQMACSTCHVVLGRDWFVRLPDAPDQEEDMLDLAAGVTATSRLSCQILLGEELDGIEVRIPGEARDVQGF